MKNEIKHTAHSTYRCEYHIVFALIIHKKWIHETYQVTKLYINDKINGTMDLDKVDNISIVRLRVNNEILKAFHMTVANIRTQ